MPAAPVAGGTNKKSHWPFSFAPTPGDFGAMFGLLSRAIGNGGVALTGTASNSLYLAIPASRQFSVCAASMQGPLGATGASAITAQLVRINNQGTPAQVTLTAAQDITTTVFTGTDNNVDFPITATGAQRYLLPGDNLFWKIVCTGNVTAPTLVAAVEIAIRQ